MAFNKKDDEFALIWAKKIKATKILGGKCERCGNDNIFCLDFHHIKNKEFDINNCKSLRWGKIESEIKKCKLLCRNCHSELRCNSNGRRHNQKRQLIEKIGKLKCEKCGYSSKNYASLDFHHLEKENKKFIISDGLYSSHRVVVTVKELMDEINKCVVLCRNCHIQEHININKFNRLKDIVMQKVENYKELQKPLDRKIIYNMYNNGKGVCRIAKELNCCKSTISMILTKYKNGSLAERPKAAVC